MDMSNERKPQPDAQRPHREKSTMDEPQEEFVDDQARPSKDRRELDPEKRPGGSRGE